MQQNSTKFLIQSWSAGKSWKPNLSNADRKTALGLASLFRCWSRTKWAPCTGSRCSRVRRWAVRPVLSWGLLHRPVGKRILGTAADWTVRLGHRWHGLWTVERQGRKSIRILASSLEAFLWEKLSVLPSCSLASCVRARRSPVDKSAIGKENNKKRLDNDVCKYKGLKSQNAIIIASG